VSGKALGAHPPEQILSSIGDLGRVKE